MKAAFLIYDLITQNLPLQPWLTIAEIAKGLYQNGHGVHIVTDVKSPAEIEGATVYCVDSIRKSRGSELIQLLHRIMPDALVFLPTPLNLFSTRWINNINSRRIAYLSYPFYNSGEVYCASRLLSWRDILPYARHLFVPQIAWRRAMYSKFDGIITQSDSTAARFNHNKKRGDIDVKAILPGIDLEKWPFRKKSHPTGGGLPLLFMGAATAIRGFDVLINAMSMVSDHDVMLKVLARGAGDREVRKIQEMANKHGVGCRVTVTGGWCDQNHLISEIHKARAVVMPFVLVPSELPVTVLEVIACGTPVICADVGGLPFAIGPAGTVVRQGSAESLAFAIKRILKDQSIISKWEAGCLMQRERMMDWGETTSEWERVLFNA